MSGESSRLPPIVIMLRLPVVLGLRTPRCVAVWQFARDVGTVSSDRGRLGRSSDRGACGQTSVGYSAETGQRALEVQIARGRDDDGESLGGRAPVALDELSHRIVTPWKCFDPGREL
jgi:hypothetical protein